MRTHLARNLLLELARHCVPACYCVHTLKRTTSSICERAHPRRSPICERVLRGVMGLKIAREKLGRNLLRLVALRFSDKDGHGDGCCETHSRLILTWPDYTVRLVPSNFHSTHSVHCMNTWVERRNDSSLARPACPRGPEGAAWSDSRALTRCPDQIPRIPKAEASERDPSRHPVTTTRMPWLSPAMILGALRKHAGSGMPSPDVRLHRTSRHHDHLDHRRWTSNTTTSKA